MKNETSFREYKVIITECGNVIYKDLKTNLLHREDGPAIEKSNGYKFWYRQGKLHREDGPAIENKNNSNMNLYYLDGMELSKEWHEKLSRKTVSRVFQVYDSVRSTESSTVEFKEDSVEIKRVGQEVEIPTRSFDEIIRLYRKINDIL